MRARRAYAAVAHAPSDDGHAILLDGRQARTPARAPLAVPTTALADAIVREWSAQDARIDPASMPMTGLANAAIDHVRPDCARFAAPLIAYAQSDLICYRDARDAALMARQAAAWDPLLLWSAQVLDAPLDITQGVLPVDQPARSAARLADAVTALGPFALAGLAPLVTIGGSLVAALALVRGAWPAATLWDAVALDEAYQQERWGHDDAAAALNARRRAEWLNAAAYLALIGPAH